MSRFVVYPYKMGSQSSRNLAMALGAIRVYPDRRYRQRDSDIVINIGNSTVPTWERSKIYNHPMNVSLASNKIATLRALDANSVPTFEWTTDADVASLWSEDYTVFCRTLTRSHSGQGIVLADSPYEIVPAPLYTKGKINHGEYRVHVFGGEVIDYRKKSRARDEDDVPPEQFTIRTNSNGWIFQQNDLRRVERIEELAKLAIRTLGLDFGAVDILKDENGDIFVIEVNTAVSMEGRTLEAYVEAINKLSI